MTRKSALILAIAVALGGCSKQDEDASAPDEEWPKHGLTEAQANEVLVTIGERTITVGEFADRLASQSPYLQARFESPERRREFLDNLVRFELLVYEAKRRGYADQPEIQRARRTAMTQQLIKKEVDTKVKLAEITDEEIQAVYDAKPHEFDRPAQVRASSILIKNRAEAEKVLAEARKLDIQQFRKLARDKSEDQASRRDGGDLQFFSADAENIPKAVRGAAFTLNRVGDVFPNVIKTVEGYHILMLTGKRAALKRTYEQAKRAIRHKLAREKKDAAMEALLERLRKDIEIEVDYDALADVRVNTSEPVQRP